MANESNWAQHPARDIQRFIEACSTTPPAIGHGPSDEQFNELACKLVAWQVAHNEAYRKVWMTRRRDDSPLIHWSEAPTVATRAFKEFDFSCLPAEQRTTVFCSSGTTGQRPSRNHHNAVSLGLYHASLRPWFERHFPQTALRPALLALTPPPAAAPHSSLVQMLEVVRVGFGGSDSVFGGSVSLAGDWVIDEAAVDRWIQRQSRGDRPVLVAGTAFNFIHLLDRLAAHDRRVHLPAGSAVMETGGYKGRSRALPRNELHASIADRLGIAPPAIVCEYGMCELGSQAYDRVAGATHKTRIFRFPPWVRTRVVSPETGREVADGGTGLLQIFDLANAYSVFAVQTEDLAIHREDGFELIGRAAAAEPRGCSLMAT